MIAPETDGSYTNWNKGARTSPALVPLLADLVNRHPTVPVRSVQELVNVIVDHANYPCPIRAAGQLHSTTACFEADGGTLVCFEGEEFSRVDVNAADRVTAGARATMLDVRNRLRPTGRELAVSPEIGNATVGSVACAGTKDSTLDHETARDLAQIASLVVEVKMVDAHGRKVKVTDAGAWALQENGDVGAPIPGLNLYLFRCSYGLLGIVYEATFQTVPAVLMGNRFEWISLWKQGPGGARELIDIPGVFGPRTDAVLGFLQPYQPFAAPPDDQGMILVERRRRTAGTEIDAQQPSEGDNIRRGVRDWMWEWGAHGAPTAVTELADALGQHSLSQVKRVLAETLVEYIQSANAALPFPPAVLALQMLPRDLAQQRILQVLQLAQTDSILTLGEQALNLLSALLPPPPPGQAPRPAWLLDLLDLLPGILLALGEYRSYRSDSLIEFKRQRNTYFDFTFWAFPQERWTSIIPKYLEFCRNFRPHVARGEEDEREEGTRFRPTLFTEVYFIGQDQKSLLSFSSRGPIFTLDIVDSRAEDDTWREMNHAYNEWAAGQSEAYADALTDDEIGRPLFNQTKHLVTTQNARALVQRAFTPAIWAQFSDAVWDANPPHAGCPNGRFVNRFFAGILNPRPAIVTS